MANQNQKEIKKLNRRTHDKVFSTQTIFKESRAVSSEIVSASHGPNAFEEPAIAKKRRLEKGWRPNRQSKKLDSD
jgi:hypothetical protein